MITSEKIALIAEALAKAQVEIHNPAKDRTADIKSDKGDYSYHYADLASILDAVRPVLAKHGIAIVQAPEVAGSVLTVTTRLLHSSGEWIETKLSGEVPATAKIQVLGSAITYLRRYALQAIVGVVAEEDDDGNQANGSQGRTEQRQRQPPPNQPPQQRQAPAPRQPPAAPASRPAGAATPAAGAPAAASAPARSAEDRYNEACEAIIERLGSAKGHDLIMAIRAKYGGDRPTEAQKVLLLRDVERTVAGEAVLPAAPAAP